MECSREDLARISGGIHRLQHYSLLSNCGPKQMQHVSFAHRKFCLFPYRLWLWLSFGNLRFHHFATQAAP
jgi:hypothetical protein